MKIYVTGNSKKWSVDDSQPDFDAWIAADPARVAAWQSAGEEYAKYQKDHNTDPVGGACDTIFSQWVRETRAELLDS